MDFTIERTGDGWRVTLRGRFTHADRAAFLRVVEAIRRAPAGTWVLDLSAVPYADSAALGMLITAHDILGHGGGRLEVVGAAGQVRRGLALTNLDQLLGV
jgi:anti-anti-sigma factor